MTWLTAAGSSVSTRKTRRSNVRATARLIGKPHPRDVTNADLVDVVGRPDVSLEYRRGLRAALTSFYGYAMTAGIVTADPTDDLPTVRCAIAAPRPATDTIWRELLAVGEARTRLMARLAGEAGLRRAEVAQVHTDDLSAGIEGPELIVHGKGGRQRVVPITDGLAIAIRELCPHGGFVFPGKIDGHMSPDAVGRLVSSAMPSGWSMHKLRHRYASRGYAATGNLRAVQEALGHVSVATTQRYTAVSTRDIRAVTIGASRY